MKTFKILTLVVLTTFVLIQNSLAKKSSLLQHLKKESMQKMCPVMGKKINKKFFVDVNNKRVYVCCKGCISAVKKNPKKYLKILQDRNEVVASTQTKCPIMGGKINKNLSVDVQGKRIYVCCAGCIKKVKADAAQIIKKFENDGVVLEKPPVVK